MQESLAGFVLHRRPYRETSFLVDVFSREQGRLSGVVRGARSTGKGRRSNTKPPIEPFRRLQVVIRGKGSLRSIDRYEIERTLQLEGDQLVGGLYLNEVLTRVLETDEPMARLFDTYEVTLVALAAGGPLSPPLRSFERVLLEELGYGIDFDCDLDGQPIGSGDYRYRGDGFERVSDSPPSDGAAPLVVPGNHLRAIGEFDFSDKAVARSALMIFRRALRPHLGEKPLQSRELLRSGKRS